MEEFLANVLSFPTIVFSVLLGVVCLYWLFALFGLASPDMFETDFDLDVSGDAVSLSGLSGLMVTLGLTGVPVSLVITLLVLYAWLISYFAVHFLVSLLPAGLFYWLAGSLVVLVAAGLSLFATAASVRPMRPLFRKLHRAATVPALLGRTCVVRSTTVDEGFGEATITLDGAHLILKVRAEPGRLQRGDQAVLLEHIPDQNAYRIVPAHEFTS